MVGVAVKVTDWPAHIVVAPAAMVTASETDGLTVIVMVFDVAVAGDAQAELEVSIHDTT